ncbi:MAG: Transcription termination protein NusB, partial [uncultured Nocardioidaceae bacterium]
VGARQVAQAGPGRPLRERASGVGARRHPAAATRRGGAAGQRLHRAAGARDRRRAGVDRRTDRVVRRGLEPRPDGRGGPQRLADRRLRAAPRRRRPRRRRGQRGGHPGPRALHRRVAGVRQRGPEQHSAQQGRPPATTGPVL